MPSLQAVTIVKRSLYTKDRIKEHSTWRADIQSALLARLANTCNGVFVSTVLYHWECSEYIDQCGYDTLDVCIERHLQKFYTITKIRLYKNANISKLQQSEKSNISLLNPEWKVTLCVEFLLHNKQNPVI